VGPVNQQAVSTVRHEGWKMVSCEQTIFC
jgi:hypothetical protein